MNGKVQSLRSMCSPSVTIKTESRNITNDYIHIIVDKIINFFFWKYNLRRISVLTPPTLVVVKLVSPDSSIDLHVFPGTFTSRNGPSYTHPVNWDLDCLFVPPLFFFLISTIDHSLSQRISISVIWHYEIKDSSFGLTSLFHHVREYGSSKVRNIEITITGRV